MISVWLRRQNGQMTLEELIGSLELDCSCKQGSWRNAGSAGIESAEAYLLLQEMLRDAGVSLHGLKLLTDDNGKPFLNISSSFSLSHSKGLLACALATDGAERDCPIGVDVECFARMSDAQMRRIAERWFTASERISFAEEPSEEKFLAIWTGKEAMAKYFGRGMAILRDCDTSHAREQGISLITRQTPKAIVTLAIPKEYEGAVEWRL